MKIEVEVYRKYDGIVGVVSFTKEDIEQMEQEDRNYSLEFFKLLKEGDELESGLSGFSPKVGSYDVIVVSKEFAEIWNNSLLVN